MSTAYIHVSRSRLRAACASLVLALLLGSAPTRAQEGRKLKTSVPPEYPELARRMNLKGKARVELTVAPDGTVTHVKEIGGSPVLLDALVRAVKKWKYMPATMESIVQVTYEFAPS
jgi:TonB family protein